MNANAHPWHRVKWLALILFVSAILSFLCTSDVIKLNFDSANPKSIRSNARTMWQLDSSDEGDDAFQNGQDRDLKSGSHSKDEDDYWRWPDDFFIKGDDDYYRFPRDPDPPKLLPVSGRDVVGFMLSSLGGTLGSSGGIGGGGIVVPIYILVLGLPPRVAIPLGSVTVLGGSLAGLMLNLKRRHPLADRPVIDWDLILVMEPLVLVGALLGAILHRVVSEKILSVFLVLLLSVVAHTTLAKAKRMYDAEKRYIEHIKSTRWDYLGRVGSTDSAYRTTGWSAEALGGPATNDNENRTNAPVIPSSPLRTLSIDSRSTIRRMDADERQRILILNPDFVTLRTDLMEQEKVTPGSKIMALLGKFSVLIFLNITLGGGAFRSPWGITCGSVAYWVVHVIMVAFLFSSAWAAQTYLINRHELKEIVRFDYVHGDIKWDPRNSVIYPFFFMVSGVFAGMFGIGGGMVTVPLMLAMGVHPAVVMATSSAMVFFTAALSASSFAIFNLILWDYAGVCIVIGFISSLMGQGIMKSVRQTGIDGSGNFERNSFIAYCIGGVILLSALLMTMQSVLHIVSSDQEEYLGMEETALCQGYRM
eukprot:Nitzschia sp. Nitz4//scaffold58_size112336//4794//6639//NITZ4_004012-RA/size112336-augustus-gene-0.0-mRNA-1//1//CDS//3329554926//3455//frame0